MTLDFNPNLKPRMNTWASYVPGRSTKPEFSTHRLPAHAKSALGSAVGIIYEWVDDEWVERFRRDKLQVKVCAGCGSPHVWRKVYRDEHDRYGRSVKDEGGKYLHGSWQPGNDVFEYLYWCGYKKCKDES